MEDEIVSSNFSSANARSKRKTILKEKRINKENNQQCTPSFSIQAKRMMFTLFCDVTTNFLNQESRQNCCVQSNERNSHRYADHSWFKGDKSKSSLLLYRNVFSAECNT